MIYRLSDFRFPDSSARLYPHNPKGEWQLEIGFGDGKFWNAHAALEPHANYLGVEISGTSLLKAQAKTRAAGRRDLLTKMPAQTLVWAVIPSSSLSRIYVNFPDPWPKAGHVEHRLLRANFFTLAADRLEMGGEIWFTTDHDEYFEFALEQATQTGFYEIIQTEPPKAALETKYAKKWEGFGLRPQHVRFRVTSQPERVPHLEVRVSHAEEDMPHSLIKLNTPDFTAQLEHFEKAVYRYGETTVVLLEVLKSSTRPVHLFLAHIEEGDLIQEVLVGLTAREGDSALVRLDRFGSPIITPGVKRAVESVTKWLEERGAKVLARAY